jgi:fumarate hydratase class II
MPPELIRAFGTLKKACALANQDLGKLPSEPCFYRRQIQTRPRSSSSAVNS